MTGASQLSHSTSGRLAFTFVDEEELLGFKIWVAELELLVGNARGRAKPDPVQCFQLLQKLVITLDRSSRPEVKEYQRRCEEAVVDVLLKGAPPPVRRLICQVLAKLYVLGDQLPLYSRVSSLQLFLGTREAFSKDMSEEIRLGALECMAALYYAQGRCLSIGVQETVAVAAKYCAARHLGERTLQAALTLLSAAVEGVGGSHRHAQSVQQDVFRAVERLLGSKEISHGTKVSCAGVLRALGGCGGAFLWASSLAGFEAVKALCLAGLEDPSPSVRTAFAQALGTIAVASTSDAAVDSVHALEKWPKYAAAQRKALSDVPTACLTAPFVEAASYSNRSSCTALAQAWVAYLTASRASMEEQAFVELALRVLEMLGAACLAAGNYQEASIVEGEGELGMGTGSGERPHAQACVLYVLRVGVIEQLGEGGQRLLLDKLAAVLSAPLGLYTPVGVVTLEAMALLLEVLGEVSAEKRAELEPAIGAKVAGPHACLRLQAASAVAALVVAEPSSAARLINASLANLDSALEKLVAATASSPPDRSRPSVPGTPRGVGSARLKPDMNSVHGWALSGAALIAASQRLPLGIPATLTAAVARYAVRLITAPQAQQEVVSCLEREAGYILLGAMCATLPAQTLAIAGADTASEAVAQAEALLALFEPALGPEVSMELDRRYCSNVSYLEHVVAMELWWRTAALQALAACVHSPLATVAAAAGGGGGGATLYKRAAALLKPTLEVLTAHAALQEPARGKGGPAGMFAGAAALLQLRLLEAYAALPSPATYAGEQETLTKLCMRAVRSAATGAAGQMLQSALCRRLDGGDAMLGPCQQGRDPLERALYSFEGVAGGPAMQPWQAGSRKGIGYATEEEGRLAAKAAAAGMAAPAVDSNPAPSPYPQPKALGAALLEAQLSLVGRIMAAVSPVNQAAILDALIGIVQGGPQKKKDKEIAKRQAAAMAAAATALAGAAALSAGGRGAAAAAQTELAPRMRQLADEVLEESTGSMALQRAAADLYAASAQLGADSAAASLVRVLCKDMAATASLSRRAALALAVGSVARSVGGLSLQAVLPIATETLVAVARATDQSISVWILHAMLLLANAAGLAFVPQLSQLLSLAEGSLLSEAVYSLPGLLPVVGRLANASVALLGPDYTFGSRPYLVCKSIINDMRALEAAGVGPEAGSWGGTQGTDDAVSAALETVLYAQMLVLFAPQAVPAKSHLPVLVSNLLSRQPRLRKAAADTLRHLAERDAAAVLAERVEPSLFAALDGETDPGVASQIKATLSTLLATGAAQEPSRWVTLCAEVVMAAAPGSTAAAEEEAAAAEEAVHDSDDDEEGAVSRPKPAAAAAASPNGAASSSGVVAPAGAKSPGLSPRLRTRLFAAQLLLQIPGLVRGGDPRHIDLAAAQAAIKAGMAGDWLVLRLQQLVDLAFRMASGQLEALRPLGVALMGAVLECWGEAEDPVVEGARLLELYQAQIVSTLRASLADGAAPSLAEQGASLAAAFLSKGLDGGEAAVLQRLMGLLVAPLARWGNGEQEGVYAEWVGVQARVALLEAHARCTALAASSDAGSATARVVRQAQSPHLQLLLDSWIGLLQDYVAVCTRPPEVTTGYRLQLCQVATEPPALLAGGAAGMPMPESNASDGKSADSEDAAADEVPAMPAGSGEVAGPTPAAVVEAVRPALLRAWPSALDAASSVVAEQPQGGGTADASAVQEQYAVLLDLSQMALGQAAEAALTASGSRDEQQQQLLGAAALPVMATALTALTRLTAPQFTATGWLAGNEVAELASLLQQLAEMVLLPLAQSGRLAAAQQAASLAHAVAEVLAHLPAGKGVELEVVSAARACLKLACTTGGSGSVAVTSAALTAVSQQLRSASPQAFIPCLLQALELGVVAASSSQQPEQLTAVTAFLGDAATTTAMWQEQQQQQPGADSNSSTDGSELFPEVESVLAAAVQALLERAEQYSSMNGAGGTNGQQLEAVLAGLLALGGVLEPAARSNNSGSSATVNSSLANTNAEVLAPASDAAAGAAASLGGFGDDDWEDDPFTEAETAAAADAQASADAGSIVASSQDQEVAPIATAVPVEAERSPLQQQPDEEAKDEKEEQQQQQEDEEEKDEEEEQQQQPDKGEAQQAQQEQAMGEEDEWGDDAFTGSSGPAAVEGEAVEVAGEAAEVAPSPAPTAEPSKSDTAPAEAAAASETEMSGLGDVEEGLVGEVVREEKQDHEKPAAEASGDAAQPPTVDGDAAANGGLEDEWGDDPFVSSTAVEEAATAGAEVAAAPTAEPAVQPEHDSTAAALAALSLASHYSDDRSAPPTSPVAAAACRLILGLLAELPRTSNAAVRLHALTALRTWFQQQQAAQRSMEPTWALQCAATSLPGALAQVHNLMGDGSGRLTEVDIQFVAEALKAGLLAVNLASSSSAAHPATGEVAQASLLRVLVPALVDVAAPEAPPTPLLVDMSVKLLTHLASSPSAPAFKEIAAQLPAATKQRLQGALQRAAADAAARQQAGAAASSRQPASSTGPMQRTTIKLNFAAFQK